ncbi:MAG TPA: hypothetical protein VFS30_00640 [Dehalococcoidia bacterium]|jgi:hypothetical protein|nr:hypothetical protein [Dehalococcoidia bacterium]
MKGLGKGFNVIPVASGIHVSLKDAGGVTFVLYEDGGDQQIVFVESIGGASGQALTTVNELYASNGIGGVWTRETSDSAAALDDNSTVEKKDTTLFDCAAIYIGADELSDGFDSVECTIDGAGICIAIIHDLAVQRAPENLPASGV